MNKIEVIRATQPWQQAGAYYVRIQGMDRNITYPCVRNSTNTTAPAAATSF